MDMLLHNNTTCERHHDEHERLNERIATIERRLLGVFIAFMLFAIPFIVRMACK